MAVTLTASGTLTTVVTTEHFVSSPKVAGSFLAYIDLSNMAAGDVVELRAYKMAVAGGTARVVEYQRYEGVQPTDDAVKKIGSIPNTLTDTNATRFSIKQTFGTSIDAPWAVLNTEDATAAVVANVTQFNGNNITAAAGIPEVKVASLAANAITTASINDGAFTAAKFASGAFDAVWSVATRVLTAATNLTTALATPTNITAGTITTVTNVTNDVGITQTGADKVWGSAVRTLTGFGTLVADVATAVWGAATRILTAGTNIVLAKGTGVTGFNDLSAAQVNTEVDTALADYDAPTKAEFDAAVVLLATAATLALVKAKTDLIPASPAATGDIPSPAQNADGWIARTRAGGSDGGRTLGQSLAPLRNKVAMTAINESAGTATMTVYDDDDTTPLYTYAVSLTTLAKSMTALDPAS